jgi:hypothetical protein
MPKLGANRFEPWQFKYPGDVTKTDVALKQWHLATEKHSAFTARSELVSCKLNTATSPNDPQGFLARRHRVHGMHPRHPKMVLAGDQFSHSRW